MRRRPLLGWHLIALCWLLVPALGMLGTGRACADDGALERDLARLGIEQLMDEQVTSVSKTSQSLIDSAAAVFVVSDEDIRRSGATLVPELLRLVPGLHVARVSSNQWAITARGFNGRFSNKLLVLVDGRTVYTPIFSGVYWEGLDLPLTDIERIEVIRGPGASLWGANAVNGIVNIITKTAADTQGGLAGVTAGDEERAIVDWRYGARAGEHLDFRLSGRHAERDGLRDARGDDAGDDWSVRRGGFRVDWRASASDLVTTQGDLYRLDLERAYSVPSGPENATITLDRGKLSGQSWLTQWEHSFSLASRTAVQFYYQRERRDDLFTHYRQDTFDLDLQHDLAITDRHAITWGLGHRLIRDDFDPAPLFDVRPRERDHRLFSAFIQTQIDVIEDRLELTIGTKLEHNSFTGWEHQPNLRAIWEPATGQRLWASVARAARTPVRIEHDQSGVALFDVQQRPDERPIRIVFGGDSDFDSEKVTSVELGYRLWPKDDLFLDLAAFYNRYDDLRSAAPLENGFGVGPDGAVQRLVIVNAERGRTRGFELSADWRPRVDWRLRLGYAYFESDFSVAGRFAGVQLFPPAFEDDRDPRHQVSLQSSIDLPHRLELDTWLRYTGEVDSVQVTGSESGVASVDDYLTLDLRLGWRPHERLELSLSGRNLIGAPRTEFLKEVNTVPTQVERSVHGRLEWRF